MHQNKLKTIISFLLLLTLLYTPLTSAYSLSEESIALLKDREDLVHSGIILWITPWGHQYPPREFPAWYIPGIVIPYDVRCGACTDTLKLYINISLSYLKALYNISDNIFINFFCEKYYPSYEWRGEIDDIRSPPSSVIEYIKNVTHDGARVYIGFSEMSACVNDNQCLLKMIGVYNSLHNIFPNASFYYYGSSKDKLDNLIKLYHEAKLELIGIDIWEYEYYSREIHPNNRLVEKLKTLASEVGWNHVILGEIGLRIDDEEAYIEPWNPKRDIRYNPNITPIYYQSLLKDLLTKNVRPAYTGIWSWNDNIYSIDSRRDILGILDSITVNNSSYIVVIPSTKNQVVAKANVSRPYNWVPIDDASIDPCLWGLEKLRKAKISGEAIMQIVNGTLHVSDHFNLSSLKLEPWYVIGYNEIILGVKPWGIPPYHKIPRKILRLPIIMEKAPRIIVYTKYCIEETNTGLDLAYDIWIKKNNQTNGVGKGDLELMIWLYHNKATPAGKIINTITLDTLINNSIQRIKWNVWVSPILGNGWTYVAITPSKPLGPCGEIAIDLTSVFEEIMPILEKYNISLSKMYIMSIELGTEVFYNKVVDVKWSLYKYILLVRSKQTNTISNLLKVKYIANNTLSYQNHLKQENTTIRLSSIKTENFNELLMGSLIILSIILLYYAYTKFRTRKAK